MEFKIAENQSRANIKIVGIGGGGGNAVNTMVENRIQGVEFIAANTDLQALEQSKADVALQCGPDLTKGLGAGAKPELGREAAEESVSEIREVLKGSDMIFITIGLGGGTGTGGGAVVARIAKELGALTVAVVTKPFLFEGKTRMKNAEKGWEELRNQVDTIITIPNDRVLAMSDKNTTFIDAMKMVDDVLVQAVRGVTDLINLPGYINPDFADVRTVMNEMGPALMGAGVSAGEKRAVEAVHNAIASPLLQDISIYGAKGVLVNIAASQDTLTMVEITEATSQIYEEAHDDANIILGVIFDDSLGKEMRVTVVATGIREESEEPLPDDVGQLAEGPTIKNETDQGVPPENQRVEENRSANPSDSPRKNKNSRQEGFDEDFFDKPTFLRIKRN